MPLANMSEIVVESVTGGCSVTPAVTLFPRDPCSLTRFTKILVTKSTSSFFDMASGAFSSSCCCWTTGTTGTTGLGLESYFLSSWVAFRDRRLSSDSLSELESLSLEFSGSTSSTGCWTFFSGFGDSGTARATWAKMVWPWLSLKGIRTSTDLGRSLVLIVSVFPFSSLMSSPESSWELGGWVIDSDGLINEADGTSCSGGITGPVPA